MNLWAAKSSTVCKSTEMDAIAWREKLQKRYAECNEDGCNLREKCDHPDVNCNLTKTDLSTAGSTDTPPETNKHTPLSVSGDSTSLRKSYSFHTPSPKGKTEGTPKQRINGGQPEDELSAVFRRRSRGVGVVDENEAEKSFREYEKRLNDKRKRSTSSTVDIVDHQLSEVLRSRRMRVDSATEDGKDDGTLDKLAEYEQRIETKRKNSLKDNSECIVDEQLSQVLKTRKERIGAESSPRGLSREDRRILIERRHSALSPRSSVTSPREREPTNSDSRMTASSSPGVTYVFNENSPSTSSPTVQVRRKRVSPGQSFDSSGEVDKNKRTLRPTRASLRKERTIDNSESALDPQLAAIMKLRQETISRQDRALGLSSDNLSRFQERLRTDEDGFTPRLKSQSPEESGHRCSNLEDGNQKPTAKANESVISTPRSSSAISKSADNRGDRKVNGGGPPVQAASSLTGSRSHQEPRQHQISRSLQGSDHQVPAVELISSDRSGPTITKLCDRLPDVDAVNVDKISAVSSSSGKVNGCETVSMAEQTSTGLPCRSPTENTNSSGEVINKYNNDRSANDSQQADVNGSNVCAASGAESVIASSAGDDITKGGGMSSDDDLLSDLGCVDTSGKKKRGTNKRRSLSDRYAAERKEEISAQLAMRREAIAASAADDDTSSSYSKLPQDTSKTSPSSTSKTSTSLTDLPSSSRTPIAERLAALRKHGNEDWKRRTANPESLTSQVGDRGRTPSGRPLSIADRLSNLSDSQASWKSKVQDKDTKQFTVEGKLGRDIGVDSPITRAARHQPRKTSSKESESSDVSELVSVPSSPLTDIAASETDRNSVASVPANQERRSPSSSAVIVEIPAVDSEDLSTFFGPDGTHKSAEKVDVSVDAFDDIFIYSNDILTTTKRIKPRRNKTGSANPVKHLSLRTDLLGSYTEDPSALEKRQSKARSVASAGSWKEQLAPEAKEGLASKEDFSKVSLRSSDSFSHPHKHRPYTDVMLIHVKGRRYCQCRLVAPIPQSVSSGDCYVLITAGCVYLWLGQYSNVIERSKASELASQIQQKHDLGVKSTADLITINEEKQTILRGAVKFWATLGSKDVCSAQAPGKNEEDELYESFISETNKVYRVTCEQLVEVEEYSGQPLKYEMLRNKECYVFDFGCEMYVWTGKHVPMERRKVAVRLANELWEKSYDYSEFSVNPFTPLLSEENGGVAVAGDKRPKWAVFGKVSQNMETTLFKEKFIDWPDSARLIKVKDHAKNAKITVGDGFDSFKPIDASLMLNDDETPVSLLLEGSHVGRGDAWIDYEDGIRREFEIITQSVDVWHVSEFSRRPVDEVSHGQFHDEDAYVICWHYAIMQITHTLSGDHSRQSSTGRSRCAYFFWHGRHSGIGEKGTSALMTVELDKEKGPHVPVDQGKEPPCFIRLFNGNMVVHMGKRDSTSSARWRLYIVRNELPDESYLWELPVEKQNLRSRSSFILVDCHKSVLYIWHGAKSTNDVVDRARELGTKLKECCPTEFGVRKDSSLVQTELKEGSECSEFWDAFVGKEQISYDSLLSDARPYDFTPRLFHLSYASGSLEFSEVLNPARCFDEDVVSPFPFLQVDIYCVDQPALFILDNHHEVFLWQGWWPVAETEESENTMTGMADTRFSASRRCAMQTVLDYCKERYPSEPPDAYLVYAGKEPKRFTNLFPYWQNDESVIALANSSVSSTSEKPERIADVLARLTEVRVYTWEELQERPLPEGVNPQRLELYIADDEFEELTGLTRQQFEAHPVWKQSAIKKEVGLF